MINYIKISAGIKQLGLLTGKLVISNYLNSIIFKKLKQYL